jgi:hypothetical protein
LTASVTLNDAPLKVKDFGISITLDTKAIANELHEWNKKFESEEERKWPRMFE